MEDLTITQLKRLKTIQKELDDKPWLQSLVHCHTIDAITQQIKDVNTIKTQFWSFCNERVIDDDEEKIFSVLNQYLAQIQQHFDNTHTIIKKAIIKATKRGHFIIVKHLLASATDDVQLVGRVMYYAMIYNRPNIFELILKSNHANHRRISTYGFQKAIERGYIQILDIYFRYAGKQPTISNVYYRSVMVAAKNGHTGIIKMFLSGLSVNDGDCVDNSCKVLSSAINYNKKAVVELFVQFYHQHHAPKSWLALVQESMEKKRVNKGVKTVLQKMIDH
jgi:hypothetical protein